ncbi:MAG: class I SAM-dependent methyltransferase [Gammaproteobacteria bacterium]|nr:class I SAM-dependent methyltransferase [Gammaproteobacteria bacterium]MBV9696051.1 class I SAM-dependent methyltransferase [Gammaproteobacteria bacterium]
MSAAGNYTLELRAVWSEFFAPLPNGARILDIGTGNGAITLIARQTAEAQGRAYEIHGVDLARIDPVRHVQGGGALFAGITFHPATPAESLPFDSATFAAAGGQFALEYTQVPRALREVHRVLQPGGAAQFVLHHSGSVVVEVAHASLRQSDLVLNQTTVYRKLRKFLAVPQHSATAANRAWQELHGSMQALRDSAAREADRHVLDVTLDALAKLLGLRGQLSSSAMAREVDYVENQLRQSARRHRDLIAVAVDAAAMESLARQARDLGFSGARYQALYHANEALVGWQLLMHKTS